MVVTIRPAVMVAAHIGALCNNPCAHGESRRMVVLVPLHNALYKGHNKNADYKEKYKAEHYLKQIKIKAEAEHNLITPFI